MPRLRVRYRILRFWLCRKRGHDVGNDQIVLAWYSPRPPEPRRDHHSRRLIRAVDDGLPHLPPSRLEPLMPRNPDRPASR